MRNRSLVILVTGGAVRVGRAISKILADKETILYCHYNSSIEDAQTLKKDIQDAGGICHLLQADLSETKSAEQLIQDIVAANDRIDVLINNAALFFKTPLGTVTGHQWDNLFDLNLKAAFFCAQAAGMQMKKQGNGHIINIGDPSGDRPWPGYIPYGITKAGIISMTKGLAKALAPEVRVNCINPGPVLIPESYTSEQRKQAVERTLLKKEGRATDISKTIRFLVHGPDYITGTIINVDGGRSIT